MCIFFSFYVKLLGDKIDEVVKEWDAQKEGFYERTGLSRGDQLMVIDNDESGVPYHDGSRGNNQLMVIDNDESGVQNHEDDDFDELDQLLEWRTSRELLLSYNPVIQPVLRDEILARLYYG